MQLHAEGLFLLHMANLQEAHSGKRIKRSICSISDKEKRILTNAMKASNRWSVLNQQIKAMRGYKII
jgi:hypothetical protein